MRDVIQEFLDKKIRVVVNERNQMEFLRCLVNNGVDLCRKYGWGIEDHQMTPVEFFNQYYGIACKTGKVPIIMVHEWGHEEYFPHIDFHDLAEDYKADDMEADEFLFLASGGRNDTHEIVISDDDLMQILQ